MKEVNKTIFKGNTQFCDIMNDIIKKDMEQIKMNIPDGYKFFGIDDNNNKVVFTKIQPKYPKTYKDCGKVVLPNSIITDKVLTSWYKCELLEILAKLLICRNAYWKIAGKEMGLDKYWEPDYTDDNIKYVISIHRNHLDFNVTIERNYILIFPTEEIRDIFYENFKELIENCKELL